MSTLSEPPEQHSTLDLRTGQIHAAGEAPRPDVDDLDEEWTELGELDRVTGRARVDYSLARPWRPLSEFWRWR